MRYYYWPQGLRMRIQQVTQAEFERALTGSISAALHEEYRTSHAGFYDQQGSAWFVLEG